MNGVVSFCGSLLIGIACLASIFSFVSFFAWLVIMKLIEPIFVQVALFLQSFSWLSSFCCSLWIIFNCACDFWIDIKASAPAINTTATMITDIDNGVWVVAFSIALISSNIFDLAKLLQHFNQGVFIWILWSNCNLMSIIFGTCL